MEDLMTAIVALEYLIEWNFKPGLVHVGPVESDYGSCIAVIFTSETFKDIPIKDRIKSTFDLIEKKFPTLLTHHTVVVEAFTKNEVSDTMLLQRVNAPTV